MRLSNALVNGIVNILNDTRFPNPHERQRAYKAMRNICEQTIKSAKAKCVHEMFRKMKLKKVTLRPVVSMCKKLYSGKAENQRRNTMERMIMEWKEDDSQYVKEKVRKELSYEWRAGNDAKVLAKYKISERFKRLVENESENEIRKQREKPTNIYTTGDLKYAK